MARAELDENLQKFLEIRQPGVELRGAQQVDVRARTSASTSTNFKKFPRVDDTVTYKKKGRDVRGEIKIDPNVDLPDYSGPFQADLRFSDFSKEQLVRMLSMSYEYYVAARRRVGRPRSASR